MNYRMVGVFLVFLVSLMTSSLPFPSKLEKAFDALRIYDYFKAKELFYKSLKRDSVPSAYGLSIIYARDDNPFTNIDSAHKFINIAERDFPKLKEKELEDYSKFGVTDSSIQLRSKMIDTLAFRRAERENTIATWNDFILRFDHLGLRKQGIEKRNELAFAQAEAAHSSEAYSDFLEKYPEANKVPLALERYELLLFQENTSENDPDSFEEFAKTYPNSPYAPKALDEVYRLKTSNGTASEYLSFVRSHPTNPNFEKAWRRIYALEVKEVSPSGIAEFTLNYPEYPFMEELRQDFDLAITRFFPIERDGYWGFIDESGKLAVEPQYEWVEAYSDGFAMVGIDDGVTYIDKEGTPLTTEVFDDAYPFSSGYGVVESEGYLGVINRLGDWVIRPEYDDVGELSEGLFYAEKNGKYGYLNREGEVAIPFRFDDGTDFHLGVAVVDSAGKKALINHQGQALTSFRFDWIEGFERPEKPSRFKIEDGYGLIDPTGRLLTDTLFDAIGEFREELALVAMNGQYGFFSLSGDTVIDFLYTYSDRALSESYFENGHAKVFQKEKVGMIDTSGTKAFPAIFEDMGTYVRPLVAVKKRGKWGYSDLKVDLAIPYEFDIAGEFRDSLAIVSRKGRYELIDTLGKPVIEADFSQLEFVDTLLLAADTSYGLITTSGDTLVEFLFEKAEVIDGSVIRFTLKTGDVQYYDYRRRAFIWREENP